MPDPGQIPDPSPPPGQAALQRLQAARNADGSPAFTGQQLVDYKNQQTQHLLAARGADGKSAFTQDDIAHYWGDATPAAPALERSFQTNLTRAASVADAGGSILSDGAKALSGAINAVVQPYWNQDAIEVRKAQASARVASDQMNASYDPNADPLQNAANLGRGVMNLGGAAWQYLVTPFTAAVNEGPDKLVHSIPIPEFGPKDYRMGGKLPEGFTGDSASTVAGFLVGGDHLAEQAPVPESTRTAAIQSTREGHLPNGPQDLVDRVTAPSPATAGIKAAIPSNVDFASAAVDIVGSPDHGAIAHVTKNLQDIWASTGTHPSEALNKARTDPVYREELVNQDIHGDPVAPHFQAFSPPQPKPVTPLETAPAAKPTFGKRQPTAPVPGEPAAEPKFENSIDTSMAIMHSLEGSGEHAVSDKGAIGGMQIMPGTARQYGFDPAQLQNPAYNKVVARTIITDLYHRFNGNMEAMSIAYNSGPGRANEWMNAGEGYRLEAIRDNTMRTGWRYEKVATSRDEAFLPAETQEYVARARYKMGNPEAEPGPGHNGGPTWSLTSPDHLGLTPEEVAAENPSETGEGEDGVTAGGTRGDAGAAARSWADATPEELYTELSSNIGEQPQGKLFSSWDDMLTHYVSELRPARVLDNLLADKGMLDQDKDLTNEDMFRQVYRSPQRASAAIRFGVIDGPETKNIIPDSPSIFKAFEEAKAAGGNPDEFRYWLVAARAEELEGRKITSGFNPDAAAALMNNAAERAKYGKAAETFYRANDGMLDYVQKSGRYSMDQIDAMKRLDSKYVSYRRLMGDTKSFGGNGKGFMTGNPLKRMEGADMQITDPLLATMDNYRVAFHSADVNFAVGHLLGLAEKDPNIAAVLGLERKDVPKDEMLDQASSALKAYGFTEDQMKAAHEAYDGIIADRADKNLKDNEFTYYRDGQRETWKIDSPEFAQLLKGSSEKIQVGLISKLVSTFASAVRAGVVMPVDFAFRSALSHQVIQFINDPGHPAPFLTGFRGLSDAFGMSDLMKDVYAKGGLGTSLMDLDRDYLKEDMDRLMTETGVFNRVRNVVGDPLGVLMTPLHLARAVQERLDMANRAGLMKQGISKGLDPRKAASRASTAGIDYAERGTSALVQQWSQWVPFFRPHLLYLKQAGEAWAKHPVQTGAYAAMAVTLPKMILFGLNMMADQQLPPDQQYAQLPQWERLYYYITPPIGGQRLKLRMPAAVGFPMGAVPEAIMQDMFTKNPVKFMALFKAAQEQYLPPSIPAIALPPLEVFANKSMLTGQPLVPGSLQGAVSELQYTPNTSVPAKALAKLLGPPMRRFTGTDVLSPIAMDHLVDGWTGTAGKMLLNAVSAPFRKAGPPLDITDIPIVQGLFLRQPGFNAQSIQDYYDEKANFDRLAASKGVIKRELKSDDQSNMGLAPEAVRYAQADAKLEKVNAALNMMRSSVWGIYENKEMNGDEKRQHIENVTNQMIDLSRSATSSMKQFEAAGPQQ